MAKLLKLRAVLIDCGARSLAQSTNSEITFRISTPNYSNTEHEAF